MANQTKLSKCSPLMLLTFTGLGDIKTVYDGFTDQTD